MWWKRFGVVCTLALFLQTTGWGQDTGQWQLLGPRAKKTTVPFRLVNNLVVVQLRINQSGPLNFIVDTGLKLTLITELSETDSLELNHAEPVTIRGLGSDVPIEAISTYDNQIQIGGLLGTNQQVVVLLDNVLQLSQKLGLRIHGIIGYELFRQHVVEIAYHKRLMRIWRHDAYRYRPSPKYQRLPLVWHRFKPYIDTQVQLCDTCAPTDMRVLVDTGSSDALWLFKSKLGNSPLPSPHLRAYLGHGLGGDVLGEKARISHLRIADYGLKHCVVSFPDSADLSSALDNPQRSGSLGGGVLTRFTAVFDYPRSTLTLRKNPQFAKPFYFNQSGVEISTPYPGMPVYVVADVRHNSDAWLAGLRPGDQILNLNGKSATLYEMQELQSILAGQSTYSIRTQISRNGTISQCHFRIRPVL